jgi:hypothetical protein
MCDPYRVSNVACVPASCDYGRPASNHSIPDGVRFFVTGFAWAQNFASE